MKIVFRTEGDHKQGMGDVWGCLALAEHCDKRKDQIMFILSKNKEGARLIREFDYNHTIAPTNRDELNMLSCFRPDVIIVNKLRNTSSYIKRLTRLSPMVVTVDDNGPGAVSADLRVNPLYCVCNSLTDPKFVTLRQEFVTFHRLHKTIRTPVHELLVMQGGSDTYGFLPKIALSLIGLDITPHITLLLGPAFKHDKQLARALSKVNRDITIVRNSAHTAKLMYRADLAITAAGLSVFELASVGTPSIVVCAERFEMETASRLQNKGVVINLGFGQGLDFQRVPEAIHRLAFDPAQRKRMSIAGKQLVDGQGASRIINLLRERTHHERGRLL